MCFEPRAGVPQPSPSSGVWAAPRWERGVCQEEPHPGWSVQAQPVPWRLAAQLLRPTSLTSAAWLGKGKWRLLGLRPCPEVLGVQLADPPASTLQHPALGRVGCAVSWGAPASVTSGCSAGTTR